ncbi:ATP-binding protein [Actinoplanes sp. NPDC089786]|uniref:ATP-binding protein n=1 Tax=Actinoplanes sp. NPDC089786 TaxID=3155185 RepID=UPI00343F5798
MEVHPPYLLDNGAEAAGSGVFVTYNVDTAVTEMVVFGQWTRRLASDTYIVLQKCLVEHPSAVIVSLHRLDDRHADSAALWLVADKAAASMQPPVQIALVIPGSGPLPRRLHRLGLPRTVPLYTAMSEAYTAVVSRRPLTDRLQLTRLSPGPGAARSARDLIDVACEAWSFPELRHPSRLVISELVTNAVQHAGTDLTVTVWRRRSGLHISVRDGSSQLRHLRPSTSVPPHGGGGDGLLIVGTLSAAWGAMSTRDGKVLWATMHSYRHTSP